MSQKDKPIAPSPEPLPSPDGKIQITIGISRNHIFLDYGEGFFAFGAKEALDIAGHLIECARELNQRVQKGLSQ